MKPLFACFSYNLDYALGWMVIHSLWQATAIALLSGVVVIVLRKKPAKVRYWVHNIAMFSVLSAAIVTFSIYYDFGKQPGEMRFIPENNLESEVVAEIDNITSSMPTSMLSMDKFQEYFNHNIPLIVTIWILGVALFMLKLLGGISYVYYLRSRMNFPADEYWIEILEGLKEKVGVKHSIELVESALTRTPMVVGHIKPMILFPIGAINRLAPSEVEAILAHEIAHVMRKDYLFNIIQSVIEALFYFHPAVWWISANIRNERENCCDDVAIEICGNSMNYAKSLVTVQEMAYYPMHIPAMAFAGNRKNQLLFRVQRILNQPQNKTNVMEKLIATCFLIVVMVGLSFGESNFRSPFVDNTPPSVDEPNLPSETTNMTSTLKGKGNFYLIFPERVDSLKVPFELQDGVYNYEDNTQTAKLTIKDNFVVALTVNDIDLKDEQLPNYKKLIDKIISTKAPQETTSSVAQNSDIQFDKNGMRINSAKTNLNVDKNGFALSATDDNGNAVNMNIDKNGLYMDATDESGQPFKLRVDENGLSMKSKKNSTYINGKVVTVYDANEHKWVIDVDKNGGKIIKHYNAKGKFIEDLTTRNGKAYINGREASEEDLNTRGWYFDGKGLQKTGGYENIQSSIKSNVTTSPSDNNFPTSNRFGTTEDIKSYRISLKDKHKALTNKALFLKRNKGIDILYSINPTLNDAGRDLSKDYATFEDLKNTERKLDWVEIFIENKENNDDSQSDIESDIEELKNDMKELRQEIKDCNCTTNFDFRMALIGRINNLLPTLKSNVGQSVYNELELKFLKIKNEWERGECMDNQDNYRSNKSDEFDSRIKALSKKAQWLKEAIDNCDCREKDPNWVKWAKNRLSAQYSLALNNRNDYDLKMIENEIARIERQFNRLKTQKGYTNCAECPPGNGQ